MRGILTLLLAIFWAALVVMGLYAFRTIEPSGDGFTRGLNRLAAFFQWELGALLVAAVAWRVSRQSPRAPTRLIGRAPIILSGGFFLLVVVVYGGAVVWSRLG
ncbi:MAG: hypothetical protein GC152_08765 [Alphaproteobacteria bacterium]|nr:hypothetical protein [Alphaproteobacteria bacterium]